jgi:hypothetical protein
MRACRDRAHRRPKPEPTAEDGHCRNLFLCQANVQNADTRTSALRKLAEANRGRTRCEKLWIGDDRDQAQFAVADANDVTGAQLPATACLPGSVHPDLFAIEECLDLGAALDNAYKLEQLAKPDHLTSNQHIAHVNKLLAAHAPGLSCQPPLQQPAIGGSSVESVGRR